MTACPLIAYDAAGRPVAMLDWMVIHDAGELVGSVDMAEAEAVHVKLRQLWIVERAVGSASWPQWLPEWRMREFRLDLDFRFSHPARRLIHDLGHVIDRADIDREVESRIRASRPDPADIRAIVGGPGWPLRLNERGEVQGQAMLARNPNVAKIPMLRWQAAQPEVAVPGNPLVNVMPVVTPGR